MSRPRYRRARRPVAPKPQPVAHTATPDPAPVITHPEPEGPSAPPATRERQPKYLRIRL